ATPTPRYKRPEPDRTGPKLRRIARRGCPYGAGGVVDHSRCVASRAGCFSISGGVVTPAADRHVGRSTCSGFRVLPHACAAYLSEKAQGPGTMLRLSFTGHRFSPAVPLSR